MTSVRMSQIIANEAFISLESSIEKKDAIAALASALVESGAISADRLDQVVESAMARESIGSTGIGHGIAIPHCRTDLVDEFVCAYGRCIEGFDFDSLDGEPVYSIFFLLTPIERKEDHIGLMKNFASQIRKEHFCSFLKEAKDSSTLISLLAEFESN